MKIADPSHIKPAFIQKKQEPAHPGDASFEKILQQEMAEAGAGATGRAVAQGLQRTTAASVQPPATRQEAATRVWRFLDVLEEYSLQLSRPHMTLRDIAPLVDRMDAEIQDMRLLSEALPADDGIKSILDETLIRSSVELMKFKRGDYA